MTVRFVVVLLAWLASTPGHACPGIFLPPFKLDLGRTWSESGTRAAAGSVLLVGLSRATLDPRPVAFDVGLGYVRWNAGDDDDTANVARSMTKSPPIADAQGAYLELAARIQASKHARSWLAVRGELLGSGFGYATRLATELWTGANERDGMLAIGALAIGLYAEAGVRDDVKTFTIGMTVRSPFVVIGGGPRRPQPVMAHSPDVRLAQESR